MSKMTALFVAVVCVVSVFAGRTANASTKQAGHYPQAGHFIYVTERTTVDPGTDAVDIADCPKGRLTGAGGSITGGVAASGADARMTRMEPADSLLFPDGNEDDGSLEEAWNPTSESQKFAAVAICMTGDRASSLAYVNKSSTTGGSNTATVFCPPGYSTVGGGAGIDAAQTTSIFTSRPDGPDGWTYTVSSAFTGDAFTGVVTCLEEGVAKLTVAAKGPVPIANGTSKQIKATCPSNSHVSGGGVLGNIGVEKSVPFDGGDADHAPDDGWVAKVRNTLRLGASASETVYAICVK